MIRKPFGAQIKAICIVKETGTPRCPGFKEGIAYASYAYGVLLKIPIARQTGKPPGFKAFALPSLVFHRIATVKHLYL